MQRKLWYNFYVAILFYTIAINILNLYLWQFDVFFLQTGSLLIIGSLVCFFAFEEGISLMIATSFIILIALAIMFLHIKKVFKPVLIVYSLDLILVIYNYFIISFAPLYIFSLVFYASAIIIIIASGLEDKGRFAKKKKTRDGSQKTGDLAIKFFN